MRMQPSDFIRMKGKEKISMLTCYDYSFARSLAGTVDILLVGDSLGNVALGFPNTRSVTFEDIASHLQAVRRGAPESFIVADMPYGTYKSRRQAISTARKLVRSGADAVKPEGKPEIVEAIVSSGIHVVAHLGLLPQTAKDYSVVGREAAVAEDLIAQSLKMQQAGAFCLVLESIPEPLAHKITHSIKIPTIGIGAGGFTDGQVLVLYDLLGLYPDFKPKFARQYLDLKKDIRAACTKFSSDVKKGRFPSKGESYI